MATTTAHEVATELRKLADSLDKQPDTVMYRPRLSMGHKYQGSEAKDIFLAVAKLLPRPLAKGDGYDHDEYTLTYEAAGLTVHAYIEKAKTCKLVKAAQPAVYDCIDILSAEDDAAIEV